MLGFAEVVESATMGDEQLRADPAAFAADVAGFLAVDPGPLHQLLQAARLNRALPAAELLRCLVLETQAALARLH